MNNYFTLRKANRLRARLLSATSQQQLREVTRYLRRVTWDKIGELLYNMLGGVVFAAIPILPFAIGNLILGGIVLAIRFYWYGKDERLTARL